MRPCYSLTPLFTFSLILACAGPGEEVPVGVPGAPLPGLTEAELARFEQGRVWFDYGWTPEEGLGPLYIQDRCSSCHDLPVLGGVGVESLTLMTSFDPVEGCDPLVEEGGPVRQEHATPLAQAAGIFREEVPRAATERVTELSPLLFGLGLMEAIPQELIESRADPDDVDGDGISGRVQRTHDGRLGRLTRKAEVASILELVEGAFATELGLTSLNHPLEQTLNGLPLPPETDPVPDPELDTEIISAVADFVRFLAPPAPETPINAATRDSISEGALLFHNVGCATCHVPALKTGPNEISALSEKTVYLYSDLLLHDLGPDHRTVCAGDATPTEFRTARLMGLRIKAPYRGVPKAFSGPILAHGGEAERAREAFESLNVEGRSLIIRFLMSL